MNKNQLLYIVWIAGVLAALLSEPTSCEATVYFSDGSQASVQALQDAALDGDTIILPAGTFSWTSRLNITKGITLQGQTTITGAGTSNPSIIDGTVIAEDTPRTGPGAGVISASLTASQSLRITGITFRYGTTTI